jgi:hypothetical protein
MLKFAVFHRDGLKSPQKNGERTGSPATTGVWPGAWSLGPAGLRAVLSSAINVEGYHSRKATKDA